jgi:hypothetical protein
LQGKYIKLAVNSNQRQDANGLGGCCCTSYPFVVVVGWQQQAGGSGGSQRVKESGPDGSS